MTGNWPRQTAGLRRWLVPLFLLGLVLAVLIPASPLWQVFPSWDSGVFLYTGRQVLNGALPYRDVWDHKPPLIFWINALGLTLGVGTRWGVWGIEVVSLFAAVLLGFDLLRRAFGGLSAAFISVAFGYSAFLIMDGGNYTTEYALPLQFASLWLVATAHDPFSPRRAYVLGILGGLLFWLKQNDIGIPLAIATYFSLGLLLTRTRRTYAVALAMLAAGVVTVTGLVLLPFALQGGLGALWDAAFLFNFLYVDTPPFQRLIALAYVPVVLPGLGLTLLAGVGWLIGAGTFVNAARQGGDVVRRWSDARVRLVPNRAKEVSGRLDETQIERLLSIALIAAPIELVLVTLAPTLFDHYHLSLLPIFSVLAAFAFCLGLAALQGEQRWRRASVVIVGVMVIALAVSSLPRATELMRRLRGRAGNLPHIIEFISQHSAPGDPIFIWGGESRVVFQTGSIVPTRFIYSAPIIRDRYADAGKIGELLEALEQRPPKLIFDSHPTEFFFEPQPHHSDLPFFEFRVSNAQTEERVNRLLARYVQRETIAGWEVYERLGP